MQSTVDTADACCETLATLVCVMASIPAIKRGLKIGITLTAVFIYCLQIGLVYKLYLNGE